MYTCSQNARRARGMSLVELLVAVVIGMLAVVVVLQVMRLSEGVRRTTSGGDDAQTVGAIALSSLSREIRQSGTGMSNANLLGCSLKLSASNTLTSLAPLQINSTDVAAGDAGSDTFLIAYGTGNGSPEGDKISAQTDSQNITMTTSTAFQLADRVVATPSVRAAPCVLTLDQVSNTPAATLSLTTGAAGVSAGVLYNLGAAPRFDAFRVYHSRLQVCDYLTQNCKSSDAANWADLAEGVVAMRAQYAKDTSAIMDGGVDADGYDQVSPVGYCSGIAGWTRVMAVRLVLVVRNGQKEPTTVTSAAPSWAGATGAAIDLSAQADWKYYRYKVIEAMLPLRNLSWPGVVSGC